MDDLLLEPLRYYNEKAKRAHHENANQYFDELLARSGIDVEQNRRTVAEYREQLEKISKLSSRLTKFKIFRILCIVGCVIAAITAFAGIGNSKIWLVPICIAAAVGLIFLIVKKINPPIKDASQLVDSEKEKANELLAIAREQTAPLNALFDDTDTFRLIERTLPEISFDRRFTRRLQREFVQQYDFVDTDDDETSIINSVAGTFMNNPFLFERQFCHQMGTCSYSGELEISWIEYYTDSEGNRCSRRVYQTLTATIEKPKPYYSYRTHLHFGHQGAPDLTFSRSAQHSERLSQKAVERRVKSGERRIQQHSRDAVKHGGSFQEMANSEFDVLFDALDRDNEVQFRMMFTPLAQRNMVALLRSTDAYGDDFEFLKLKRDNVIISEHAQDWDMNTSVENYQDFDVDKIRDKFVSFNNTYFKSVFFDFAPLLAIPLYQREPVDSLEDITEEIGNQTRYEHEIIANGFKNSLIEHPDTITDVIIKTRSKRIDDVSDLVEINAYSYGGVERIEYVSVLGGDGNYHNVPVRWIEYYPLERTSYMTVHALDLSGKEYDAEIGTLADGVLSGLESPTVYGHGLLGYLINTEADEDAQCVCDKFALAAKILREKYKTDTIA